MQIGDIDQDGHWDVLAAKFKRHTSKPGGRDTNQPPYPVGIFYNKAGNGSAWEQQDLSEEGIYAGVLRDVGSDGDLDIVGPLSYWTGPILLYENITGNPTSKSQ